jgi:penicillin-binding protein 1C
MSNVSRGRIVSGASTITQQLTRLTYPGPRSYYRKTVEVCRSLRMESALSKDEILRRYLDRVPMGNNLMGVEAGAWAYFGKTTAQLTAGEAALLAALVKAPGTLNPCGPRRERLLARQRWVLSRMAQLGYLSPQELQAASQTVRFRGQRSPPGLPFEAPIISLVWPGETGRASESGRPWIAAS